MIADIRLKDSIKFGSVYKCTARLIKSGPRMWKKEYCSLSLPSVVGLASLDFLDLVDVFFFLGFFTNTHFPSTFSYPGLHLHIKVPGKLSQISVSSSHGSFSALHSLTSKTERDCGG